MNENFRNSCLDSDFLDSCFWAPLFVTGCKTEKNNKNFIKLHFIIIFTDVSTTSWRCRRNNAYSTKSSLRLVWLRNVTIWVRRLQDVTATSVFMTFDTTVSITLLFIFLLLSEHILLLLRRLIWIFWKFDSKR